MEFRFDKCNTEECLALCYICSRGSFAECQWPLVCLSGATLSHSLIEHFCVAAFSKTEPPGVPPSICSAAPAIMTLHRPWVFLRDTASMACSSCGSETSTDNFQGQIARPSSGEIAVTIFSKLTSVEAAFYFLWDNSAIPVSVSVLFCVEYLASLSWHSSEPFRLSSHSFSSRSTTWIFGFILSSAALS